MPMSPLFPRLLTVTGIALALAACTTINMPPDTAAAGAPVVDASVHQNGSSAAATTYPVGSATVQPMTGSALSGLHLQAGTFANQSNAERVAAEIRSKLPSLAQQVFVGSRGSNFRVLVGPFATAQEREAAANAIRTTTGKDVANAAP